MDRSYTGIVNEWGGAIMRSEPDSSSKVVDELEIFDEFEILERLKDWSKISFNGHTGFIRNSVYIYPIGGKK